MTDLLNQAESLLRDWVLAPLSQFFDNLNPSERPVLYALLATAAALGFGLGRRRSKKPRRFRTFGDWRFPTFQNPGEERVARVLRSQFPAPDYHLMNHVTLRMHDGTTQVDHILISRFGVFVIETKDYSGWIFANPSGPVWTRVHFRRKHQFQNPIRQNYRHVLAVRGLLEFLPAEAITSLVVFSGNAVFKTERPAGVVLLDELGDVVKQQTNEVISRNRLHLCVGRLEVERLAISGETDIEHVQNLTRRFGASSELRE